MRLHRIISFYILLIVGFVASKGMAATYTSYLVDTSNGGWSLDYSAHIWSNEGGDYSPWANHVPLTYTGKLAVIDGVRYPVYKLSIEWEYEPSGFLFLKEEKSGGDLTFEDGAYYDYKPNATVKIELDTATFEDYEPETYTIYYIDTEKWGAENTAVHLWGNNGPLKEWTDNDTMTDTGKCVRIDDRYYYVYSYTFTYFGPLLGLIFHDPISGKATPIFSNIVDGGYYMYSMGSGDTPQSADEITFYDTDKVVKNITLYFLDTSDWGAENTLVHAWGDCGDLTAWAHNESMTDTGKFADINGTYYPVYSYSFTYLGEPTEVLFHTPPDASDIPYQYTPSLEIVNNGYYIYRGNDSKLMDEAPELVDEIPEAKMFTIYFADTDSWGAGNTLVHIWDGNNVEQSEWFSNPPMTPTGRYVLVNGTQWAPVYQLQVEMHKIGGLIFHHSVFSKQTADLNFVEGACYAYNSNRSYFPPFEIDLESLPTEVPTSTGRGATFMVNLGANQVAEGLWQEPCCHIGRRGTDSYQVPARGSEEYNKEKMTMAEPGLYIYTVDDLGDANDVIFYYYGRSSEAQANCFPASGSTCFDPTTWSVYAFDIGLDCVHQSFVTPEQYFEDKADDIDHIFLTGSPNIDPALDGLDPSRSVELTRDEGIFVYKFNVEESEQLMFKLSWIDVNHYKALAGAVEETVIGDEPSIYYVGQRSWATFNLGIIGCETEQTDEWRDKHILSEAGSNRMVILYLNTTMGYNSITQYGWEVSTEHGGVPTGDCWLVVDTHENDRSVSLLSFDPNPGITVREVDYAILEMTPDQAMALSDPSSIASASDANGPLILDKINVINGTADVKAVGNVLLEEKDYSVVYSVYHNNVRINSVKGVPSSIDVPYMSAGIDSQIAVRARYTDGTTKRSFCSHFAKGDVTAELPTLVTPKSEITDKQLLHYSWDNAKPVLSAAAALSYEPDKERQLAYYPDFELTGVTVNDKSVETKASLLHSDHQVIAGNLFDSYLDGWTPSALYDADSDGANTHWSNLISEHGNIPVLLDDLETLDDLESQNNVAVSFKVKAIHPFIVRRNDIETAAEVEPSAMPRRAAARAALPADLENYTIVTPTTSTVVDGDLSTPITTALKTVSANSENCAEAEYFNLSGMKVNINTSAPGLYIERRGNSARKIIIR